MKVDYVIIRFQARTGPLADNAASLVAKDHGHMAWREPLMTESPNDGSFASTNTSPSLGPSVSSITIGWDSE